mmetsp:Transcript_17148/g.23681  ORF Transcript_17148/g.23681 Transcript_17148/m.23681 type:complete len:214 (-) Transcript_17148:91-732(-)
MHAKLAETQAQDPPSPLHKFSFSPLASYECSLEGLRSAYTITMPFTRGGLLFYNKQGHYTLGLSPLVLHWKDQHCSNYFIDTDKDGNVLPQQSLVLRFQAQSGNLVTGDDPPVALAVMPQDFVTTHAESLREGLLLRCVVGEKGLSLDAQGRPLTVDVHLDGLANQRRGGADSFTKILFQYAARHHPLTFEHILETVSLQSSSQVQLVPMNDD